MQNIFFIYSDPLQGQLSENDVTLPIIIIGALCLVAGAMAILLPETLNKSLPDTLEEVAKALGEPHALICCASRQDYKQPDTHALYTTGEAEVNWEVDKDKINGDHVTAF